jgi:2-isopropylmalate synthase
LYLFKDPFHLRFFQEIQSAPLSCAKVVAFGSTCRPGIAPQKDSNLQALIESRTRAIALFGKSWDIHPLQAMQITLDQNLEMIHDSIRYLKGRVAEVLFDAEHFFDGFKANKKYALACLKAAEKAGADVLCLCDTNGGTLAFEVQKTFLEVKKHVKRPLGIHAHNNQQLAFGNTIEAIIHNANYLDSTIYGLGRAAGNCPTELLLGFLKTYQEITTPQFKEMTGASRKFSIPLIEYFR